MQRRIEHGGGAFSRGRSMIPFSYSIPDEFIVTSVPEKTQLQSFVVPNTRPFGPGEQQLYYDEYRRSRFAVTRKKGGWDCMRHYEIIANGCIPIFENLEACPYFTMTTFPKELVLKANRELLPWDDSYILKYNEIVEQLLDHCRKYCSVSARTESFLRKFPGAKKILMLSGRSFTNYSRETLAIGLRRKLGANFVDYPKIETLYAGAEMTNAYGFGYSYGGLLPDIPIDRAVTLGRLQKHEFDCIIYGKVGYGEEPDGDTQVLDVPRNYSPTEIAFLYGGDGLQDTKDPSNPWTQHLARHCNRGLCFVRELA